MISGLEIVRLRSLPINLLYSEPSGRGSPSDAESFVFGSTRTEVGFKPSKPMSSSNDNVYLRRERKISFVDLANSKPKKYLTGPRSLSLKATCNSYLT